MRFGRLRPALSVGILLSVALLPLHAAGPHSRSRDSDSARRIDAAFERALGPKAVTPPLTDDETFLRRVTLDLTGKLPTRDQARAFRGDRAALVDQLLASDLYAVNWGRYWRDVVTYHTPASNNYLRWELFDQWWFEQLRNNRPWDSVVSALVTADGINDEVAPVNYLTALYGNPIEIAATTSRVFLGLQIQCAECHHAKVAPHWKREQFHGFAAFFGRAKIIQHKDVEGRGTPYAIEGREDGQYQMTDKKDPSRLLDMQPTFLTGETVSSDASDSERREALARYLTSPKNPWFAKAYVNRMWTALLGWGFYPSVQDLGTAKPIYPEVLDILEKDWVASGHDVRWLFRTITATQAYQRQIQPQATRTKPAGAALCPQRLRPEQIFEALMATLEFDENEKAVPAPAPSAAPAAKRHAGLRHMVYHNFKVNPSTPNAEVQGTIPQALLMMNSALVNVYTGARGRTVLGRLIEEGKTDDQIIEALYQKALARRPTQTEQHTCRRFIARVGDRHEALEDVFWALINSTEFITKR